MREAVTSDLQVLQVMKKAKKPLTSAAIAELLGLTVFQITARLKGMEKRGYADRTPDKLWFLSPSGTTAADMPPAEAAKLASSRPKASTSAVRAAVASSFAPDDSKVKRVQSMGKKEGWKVRTIMDRGASKMYEIFVAPDGVEYVRAHTNEVADLIREYPKDGLPNSRLRVYSASSEKKRLDKAEAEWQKDQGRTEAKKVDNLPACIFCQKKDSDVILLKDRIEAMGLPFDSHYAHNKCAAAKEKELAVLKAQEQARIQPHKKTQETINLGKGKTAKVTVIHTKKKPVAKKKK